MLGSFGQNKHSMIGLDIGTYAVKMIQFVKQANGLAVSASGCYRFSEPLHADHDQRREMLIEACNKIRHSAPFHGDRVVSAIPCDRIIYKNIRLPQMPPDERAEAVKWEAIDRLGLDENEVTIHFVTTGEVHHGGEARDEVIIMAVHNDHVQAHMDTLLAAHLQPSAIETTPTALCRAYARTVRRGGDQESVRALVDIGAKTSNVLIMRGNRIMFYKPIEVGGETLTEAVAGHLDLSKQDAWEIRQKVAGVMGEDEGDAALFGSTRRENIERAVQESVRPCLTELAKEIGLCLRYYSVTFRGSRPEALSLVGGESNDQKFIDVLREELDMEVDVVSPLNGIDLSHSGSSIERRGSQSEWAVATGLAMRERPSAVYRLRGAA